MDLDVAHKLDTDIEPKEITQDCDTGLNIASFGYYDGVRFAKKNNLEQTTHMNDILNGPSFIVCCGDVMVQVNPEHYPEMDRRIL